MASVPEKLVESVVREVEGRMKDPQYAQVAVGQFVQSQPTVARYLSAKSASIGQEGVIHAAFHGELMSECYRRHGGRPMLPPLGFDELDEASHDSTKRFSKLEPALASYVASNVDEPELREVLALLGVALHYAI